MDAVRDGKTTATKDLPARLEGSDLRYWTTKVQPGVERANQLLQQAQQMEQQAQQMRAEAQGLYGAMQSHVEYLGPEYSFNPEKDFVDRDGTIKRGVLDPKGQTTPA